MKLVPFESLGVVSYSPSIVTMGVCVAICELFSIKEWCDLENRVRIRSRSLEMAPSERLHTSSYSPSIALCYLVSPARYNNLLVENCKIFISDLYLAPPQGSPRRNFVKMFDSDKIRMIVLPYGEKNYDNMLSPFHPIPERYGQTHGRTDR